MAIEAFTGYGFLVPTLEIYDFLQIDRLEEVDPNSEAVVYLVSRSDPALGPGRC